MSYQTPARADSLSSSPISVQGEKDITALFGGGSVRPITQSYGSLVQLNPQPLPPGSLVQLNPQPLPPSRFHLGRFIRLNPQPEPPERGSELDLK